jgi:hypothetical protein
MAIALVNSAKIPGSPSGGTSAPIDTTGVNLLVVSNSWFITDAPPQDSFNNTWVEAVTESDSNFGLSIYYVLNPTVGPGHTFTLSGSQFMSGSVEAFSGVASIGQTSGTNAGSGSSVQPGSITPVGNGHLFIGAISENGAPTDNSVAVNSGFTITDQQPFTSGQFFGSAMGYLIQSAAAAVNPTFSWSGGAAAVNAAMVEFLPTVVTGHSVSGNAGVADAVVNYSGQSSGSTTADGSGNYTISSLADGNYQITPSLAGYLFTPASKSVTVSGSNVTGVDFTAAATHGWSPVDCRNYATFPNFGVVQPDGSIFYIGQTPCNSSVPTPDARAAGAPIDSRASKPENSRNNPGDL